MTASDVGYRAALLQQSRNLRMPPASRPGQRRSPGRIVGKVRFCPALQKELDHFELAELRGPTERSRTNVFVTRVQIRAVIDEKRRFLNIALPGKFVQRSDPQPIGMARIHAVREEK